MRITECYCEIEVYHVIDRYGMATSAIDGDLWSIRDRLQQQGKKGMGFGRPEDHPGVVEEWFDGYRTSEGAIIHQGPYLFRRYADKQVIYFSSWWHEGDIGRSPYCRAEVAAQSISRGYAGVLVKLHYETQDHGIAGTLSYRDGSLLQT